MLLEDEPWPRCSECQAPLCQFLQLKLRDLPKGFSGLDREGVLQLFGCVGVDCDDCGRRGEDEDRFAVIGARDEHAPVLVI